MDKDGTEKFRKLENTFFRSSVLQCVDSCLPCVLSANPWEAGAKAILTRIDEMGTGTVVFWSRKLNNAEQVHPTHERELLAVVHGLGTWRSYSHRSKFKHFNWSLSVEIPQFSIQPFQKTGQMGRAYARIYLRLAVHNGIFLSERIYLDELTISFKSQLVLLKTYCL